MVFDCPRFEVVFGSTSAWLIFVDHAVTIVSCCVEISSFFAKNLTEIMFLFSVLPKNNVAILCICVSILSTCLVVSVHSFRKQMSVISDSWCLIRLNSCLTTNNVAVSCSRRNRCRTFIGNARYIFVAWRRSNNYKECFLTEITSLFNIVRCLRFFYKIDQLKRLWHKMRRNSKTKRC